MKKKTTVLLFVSVISTIFFSLFVILQIFSFNGEVHSRERRSADVLFDDKYTEAYWDEFPTFEPLLGFDGEFDLKIARDETIPLDALQDESLLPGVLICEQPEATTPSRAPEPTPSYTAEPTPSSTTTTTTTASPRQKIPKENFDRDSPSLLETTEPTPRSTIVIGLSGLQETTESEDRGLIDTLVVDVGDGDHNQVDNKNDGKEAIKDTVGKQTKTDSKTPDKGEDPLAKPPAEVSPDKLPIVSGWRNPKKNIGCCPPGDRRGTPFPEGMACCYSEVYNASSQFCCASKGMVLTNTKEEINFCYPADRIPFCRLKDLELSKYRPMDIRCRYKGRKRKTPALCSFVCPVGSQVRGEKRILCLPQGVWTEVNPICCEGCPPSFIQDIWFLVDIDESVGVPALAAVRTFIRYLTSYFPISQEQVRVAVTAYNQVIFTNQNTWYLNKYNNSASLQRAINRLPSEGRGRATGEALLWVAEKGLVEEKGDRPEVENIVVLITTGSPEDESLAASAEVLREKARLIVITVGKDLPSSLFESIVSSPSYQNFLEIPSYHYLDRHNKYLYDLLCEENCLTSNNNRKTTA